MAATEVNGTAGGQTQAEPIEVSFPLPLAPQTNIHLQLHNNGSNILLFLATASSDVTATVSLGSFVYAMPNVRSSSRLLPFIRRISADHVSCI